METLDRGILSRDVYECWQEPCSEIEPFLRLSPNTVQAWILGLGSWKRVAGNHAVFACYVDDRAIEIIDILWSNYESDHDKWGHYDQHLLLAGIAFQRAAGHTQSRVLDYAKNLFSMRVLRYARVADAPLLLPATTEPVNSRPEVTNSTLEQQWVERHRYEFAGKWVALEGERLLASGDSAKAVYQRAVQIGVQRPLVVKVDPPDQPPFAGW